MGIDIDVEKDYFYWLCGLVEADNEEKSYIRLARELHEMPFESFVSHDENRAIDGENLREDYLMITNYPRYIRLNLGECTVFEMLVALAKRIDYETSSAKIDEDNTPFWFWEMIKNLGLSPFSDRDFDRLKGEIAIEEVLIRLVERKYEPSGRGGLFPLKDAKCDQRRVEIWYQMNSYLMERDAG